MELLERDELRLPRNWDHLKQYRNTQVASHICKHIQSLMCVVSSHPYRTLSGNPAKTPLNLRYRWIFACHWLCTKLPGGLTNGRLLNKADWSWRQHTIHCSALLLQRDDFSHILSQRYPISRLIRQAMGCLCECWLRLIFCPSSWKHLCNILLYWTAL